MKDNEIYRRREFFSVHAASGSDWLKSSTHGLVEHPYVWHKTGAKLAAYSKLKFCGCNPSLGYIKIIDISANLSAQVIKAEVNLQGQSKEEHANLERDVEIIAQRLRDLESKVDSCIDQLDASLSRLSEQRRQIDTIKREMSFGS